MKLKKISTYTNPSKEFKYLDGVIYSLDYKKNPAIQAAIRQFKYKFTQDLSDLFGELISNKLYELNMNRGKTNVLIPVPLHKKRLNYRGFNQAELIAKSVSGDNILVKNALVRIRNTDQQAKLSKEEREINLSNAFEVKGLDIDDSIHFIVDDVCTTGSTLESCAKALKRFGLKKVYGLVVARSLAQKL